MWWIFNVIVLPSLIIPFYTSHTPTCSGSYCPSDHRWTHTSHIRWLQRRRGECAVQPVVGVEFVLAQICDGISTCNENASLRRNRKRERRYGEVDPDSARLIAMWLFLKREWRHVLNKNYNIKSNYVIKKEENKSKHTSGVEFFHLWAPSTRSNATVTVDCGLWIVVIIHNYPQKT